MFEPPAWSTWRRTDDLDEANAPSERFGTLRRRCVGRGPLGMRSINVFLEGVATAWAATAVGQLVTANTAVPLVHIPLRQPLTFRQGQRHFEASVGQAVYFPPSAGYTLGYSKDSPVFSLALTAAALDEELRARGHGMHAAERQPTATRPIAPVLESQLEEILADLHAAGPPDAGSPAAAALGARLVSWAADLIDAGHQVSKASAASDARLRRVEEWVDANLGDPITLGLLCRVADLEASSLRKSFHRRRGLSPMQWVWQRRMATARMRLMTAAGDEKVIHVASDCGLAHAGRFSVAYRRRYGESPSFTLASALEGAGPGVSPVVGG